MNRKAAAAVIGLMLAAGVAVGPAALAAVTVSVPCSTPALAGAMASAADDATLSLAAGCAYVLTAALPEATQSMSITGNGATLQRSAARGVHEFPILQVDGANATLAASGLTFRNGGPAISVLDGSTLGVSGCAFIRNTGGIYSGSQAGGQGTVYVSDSTFTANTGGAIYNNNFAGPGAYVSDSTFTANTGGAIVDINATGGGVGGSRFYRNSAADGGAIYFSTGEGEYLSDDVFSGNDASADGGAIYADDGSNGASIQDVTMTGNHAGGDGGGADLPATSILTGTSIQGNSAADGGGVYSSMSAGVILEDSVVLGNEPDNCDGAVIGCANAGPIVSGYRTNKCVEDDNDSSANDTNIVLRGCDGGAAQNWTAEDDGTIRINGKCLDIYRDEKTSKARVELWACTGGANQQWQPRNGTLVNPVSGKCLDDPRFDVTDGTRLEIYACNNGANQQWELSEPVADKSAQATHDSGRRTPLLHLPQRHDQ
jgi:predicted outer membrane repeat protein